jgi:hypothetical protein
MNTKLILGAAALVALLLIAPRACTSPDETVRQLSQMGYTEIKTTGYDFFACSDDDSFSTGFEATSPNGTRVTGVYCSGWMKAGTIRFY